jgi:succinyl-CoA synthetase beta subunit
MDLLEYQAKELFREVGIPVLPSQCIDHPRELKHLEIPYPVVLKSQVPTGGRGKAGGIRFVENTIDAIAAARAIFNLSILDQYPQVLLAEARYDAEQEFFLAVILDYALGRPVLLGSVQGGVNVEAVMEKMQRVVVEQEFSPFYARRLALKMGLQGNLIKAVSRIIEKMYQLFLEKDLDLIEINPLAISSDGEVMALDGKISANDLALGRHRELATFGTPTHNGNGKSPKRESEKLTELNWTDTEGNIGILCNSTCLAATTLDLIYQAKSKPASCLIVDGYASWDVQTTASGVQQLQDALEQIISTEGIKVILVNILSNTEASAEIKEVIATYLLARTGESSLIQEVNWEKPTNISHSIDEQRNGTRTLERSFTPVSKLPQFVIRIVGGKMDLTKEGLAAIPVHWIEDLDLAVAKAISLSKLEE